MELTHSKKEGHVPPLYDIPTAHIFLSSAGFAGHTDSEASAFDRGTAMSTAFSLVYDMNRIPLYRG